jgi:signal transduction histidine kinase
MKILVVEDDKKSSSFIAGGLKQAGFVVDCACDGEDGLAKAIGAEYGAVAKTALTERTSAESRGEALSDCLEETDKVLALLNALMEVSEAEAGVLRLSREAVNLAEVAAEVGEIYGYAAEAKGVTIAVKIESGLTLACDRTRVRQALGNLVDNAVKYSPAGSDVSISLAEDGGAAVLGQGN